MEPTIYKPSIYKGAWIYKGAGGIYNGIGVYNDENDFIYLTYYEVLNNITYYDKPKIGHEEDFLGENNYLIINNASPLNITGVKVTKKNNINSSFFSYDTPKKFSFETFIRIGGTINYNQALVILETKLFFFGADYWQFGNSFGVILYGAYIDSYNLYNGAILSSTADNYRWIKTPLNANQDIFLSAVFDSDTKQINVFCNGVKYVSFISKQDFGNIGICISPRQNLEIILTQMCLIRGDKSIADSYPVPTEPYFTT